MTQYDPDEPVGQQHPSPYPPPYQPGYQQGYAPGYQQAYQYPPYTQPYPVAGYNMPGGIFNNNACTKFKSYVL